MASEMEEDLRKNRGTPLKSEPDGEIDFPTPKSQKIDHPFYQLGEIDPADVKNLFPSVMPAPIDPSNPFEFFS